MSDDLINSIKIAAGNLFIELGFHPAIVSDASAYEHKGGYHKFTFINGFHGFVIEYAESLDRAQKGLYEDGDLYPISLGQKEILIQLREDIKKYYL